MTAADADRIPVELPLLRPIFDAMGVGVWAADRDGITTACNPQVERILGYPEQVVRGRPLHDLVHRRPDGSPIPPDECPITRVLRDGRAAEGSRATFRRADGTLLEVNWGAAPVVVGGEVTGVIVAFFEAGDTVTEARSRRELEAARTATETLQRSLLSRPPEVPGLRISASYHPAVAEARLGGDWYDAFVLPSGSVVVVIGDVAGHDRPAAAAMAQVRNLLRACAADGGEPDQILSRLDNTVATFDVTDFVTLVFGCLRRGEPGWEFSWSNAGHPPPFLLGPAGSVRRLADPVDPPLGGLAVPRRSAGMRLPAGSTLLLYTDGLVERRRQPIEEGLDRLQELLATSVREPHAMLSRVIDELGREPEDDVAVLAVQVLD